MVNCPDFSICYFQLRKKMFTKLLLSKKMDGGTMVEIVDKNVFKTMSNNLVLVCKF